VSASSLRGPRPSQPAPGRGSVRRFRCEAYSGTPVRAGARRQKEKRKSAETFSINHFGLVLLIGDFRSFSTDEPIAVLFLALDSNKSIPHGSLEPSGLGSSKRKVMRLHQDS
jgi:hypothetical protein